ncbi:MAG: penicillin acylase family protein [Balneolaceae bacterium]|nr:penicillin acylase family protein [Balneolaceae bacterium]
MKSLLRILLLILIVITGIAGIAFYWTFYRPLPDYDTRISHQKLNEEVNIHWDSFGVPHIYASNESDLYYALGYVHAQDRLWQMNLTQIAAQGRFAEFFGKELIEFDQHQRTIGFWRTAKKIEASLTDENKKILQAYADGVNNYIQNNKRDLPIQFALADMEPITWTTTHSIALARLMAWELNIAWKVELNYNVLNQLLSERKFRELFPNDKLYTGLQPQPNTNLLKKLTPFLATNEKLRKLMGSQGSHVGSNAWAVDSSKTDTDYPLLAGDPHLGLNMPGKWYEVHLNLSGRNLSGATIAGAPAVILGQNDALTWSLTNIMLDDTDFFQEAVNPQDSTEYVLDYLAGEPIHESFTVQREVIKVKNEDDTTFTRRLTKHGPVISDAYDLPDEFNNQVITMQWTGHEVSNEFGALIDMGWATSMDEFQEAAQNFKAPGQNLVYADTAGNIARFSLGNIPIRSGNPILIRTGWNPSQDWQGYIPFEELPHTINPDKGWVANANNPTAPSNYPYYISVYWEPDSRYNRITQYMNDNNILTSEAFQVMQNDSYSDYASKMTAYILPVLKENPGQFSTAISYLENWDFRYETSETAASIMDVFLLRFTRNTLGDEMGKEVYNNFIRFTSQPTRAMLRFLEDGSSFFDNVTTDSTETENEIIVQSMNEALSFLNEKFGSEPFEWRWEKLHTLTIEPPLFGQAASDSNASASLKLIVNHLLSKGPYPARGHHMSINNGEYLWNEPYKMILGASIRRIIDLSDMSQSLSIMPTGQSGNPLSEYYGDQTDSWLNGQYKFIYQDSSFFNENQYRTMKFVPTK